MEFYENHFEIGGIKHRKAMVCFAVPEDFNKGVGMVRRIDIRRIFGELSAALAWLGKQRS